MIKNCHKIKTFKKLIQIIKFLNNFINRYSQFLKNKFYNNQINNQTKNQINHKNLL